MRIGPMHDRIRIEEPATVKDGFGAPSRQWTAVYESAAQIETLNGREYFSNNREEAADTVRIRMRYPPRALNLTSDHRAIDTRRGIVYAISAVLFDDKRTLMTLACTSGVSDG